MDESARFIALLARAGPLRSGTDSPACGSGTVDRWTGSACALCLLALASCARQQGGVPNRFGDSGRMIAMSGAEAGASNACFTCHGLDGRGDGAGVPRLAGLDRGYLAHQLEAFADGRRQNASMRWIAGQLTPAERLRVAEYYSTLPAASGGTADAPVPAIYASGDPGREIPPCASCHGVDARGIGSGIPPLAGQPAAYIAQQLDDWRRGRRRSDPDGVMLEIARALSLRETAAVAAYVSALPAAHPPSGPSEASLPGRRPGPRNGASALPQRVAGS